MAVECLARRPAGNLLIDLGVRFRRVFKSAADRGSMVRMFKPWHLPFLFVTGLVAGFVDSIAGGGGLITLPVLLSFGLNPQQALGTNKLQATFGSASASWHYAQARTVPLGHCARGFVLSLTGAALGTLAVRQLDPSSRDRAYTPRFSFARAPRGR